MQINDSIPDQMNQNSWKYNQRVFIFYKFLDFYAYINLKNIGKWICCWSGLKKNMDFLFPTEL